MVLSKRILLLLLLCFCSAIYAEDPRPQSLKNWEYCWGDSPSNPDGVPIWAIDSGAGEWQTLKLPRNPNLRENNSYLWMRTRLPDTTWRNPALYLPGVYYNFEVYLEGDMLYRFGDPDGTSEKFPGVPWHTIPLREDCQGRFLYLRIHSQLPKVGIIGIPAIGSRADFLLRIVQQDLVLLIFGFLFVCVGFFQLLIFLRRREHKVCLAFGGFTIAMGLYTLCWVQIRLLIWNAPLLYAYVEYVSLYSIPMFFCMFFEQVSSAGPGKIVRRAWQIHLFFLCGCLLLALFDASIWVWTLSGFQIALLIDILMMLVLAIWAAFRGDVNARLFTIGFFLMAAFAIYDTLGDLGFLPWAGSLSHWGTFLFVVCLGLIVERDFSRAHRLLKEYTCDLEFKNAELSRMDKLKDEFLANTSHELRTPLNGIIGIAESMVDGAAGELNDNQSYNLSLIVSSGKRLSGLVNDLLDFSKLQHQTIELKNKPVDMHSLTDVVFSLLSPLLADKPVQLFNSVPKDVPAVEADEDRLQQIMHNLVGNAIKFTHEGQIEVTTQPAGRYLEITVSDTGIGIPRDKWDAIFESFQQADGSTAREYGGTGLGLTLTQKMVELHGGTIRMHSQVGKGSQFTFTLSLSSEKAIPLEVTAPAPAAAIAKPLTEETAAVTKGTGNERGSILIVDDEPINLQVLKNHLTVKNYSVTQAHSGEEALRFIDSGMRPDLVLLDVMMPKMSGYEVCRKIRENFPSHEIPVVILTAKNQLEDLVSSLQAGANDHLTKPVGKKELLARVKTYIRLNKINASCARFVPWEFLRFLGHESIVDIGLGDQVHMDMTVLFSDIRSFTTLSEGMTPYENFNFINAYLKRVGPVIRQHSGFIDKYIGDAVMALFREGAEGGICAAIEMMQAVEKYNAERIQYGRKPIHIGIGLHTGPLMLGIVGEIERIEGTVIGDAVNLASRLEGLTKEYGASILVSEETLQQIAKREKYPHRLLGRVRVKGKKQYVTVYEIFAADSAAICERKQGSREEFEQAVTLYQQGEFFQALEKFAIIAAQNDADKAAELYVERCQKSLMEETR